MSDRTITRSGLLLGLASILVVAMVSLAYYLTRDAIEESEYQALLQALNSIVPADSYDNDLVNDTRPLPANKQLGLKKDALVYRARRNGEIIAVAFPLTAPDGYNGPVDMLLAVDRQHRVLGMRVISHKETPGLGDRIESRRSDWADSFRGKSLGNPPPEKWKVKKDGGVFDQFTGATITPRIIINALRRALLYVEAEPGDFFDE
jgi:electron transport complex protein RnfG